MYNQWLSAGIQPTPLMPQFQYVEDPFTDEEDIDQLFNVIDRAFYEVIHPDFSHSERGEPLEEISRRKNDPRLEGALFYAFQNFKALMNGGQVNMDEGHFRSEVCQLFHHLEFGAEDGKIGYFEGGSNDNTEAYSKSMGEGFINYAELVGLIEGSHVEWDGETDSETDSDEGSENRLRYDLAQISAQYNTALRRVRGES